MARRMLGFDVAEFLEACRIASEGGGVDAVCQLLGLTPQQVWNRRHQLKKKGVPMPALRRYSAARVRRERKPARKQSSAGVAGVFVIDVNGGGYEV